MSEQAALFFSIVWLSAINLCWLMPWPRMPWQKVAGWLFTCALMLLLAYAIESYTRPQPHMAWQTADIYLVYACACLFFSAPGFLLWRSRKKKA